MGKSLQLTSNNNFLVQRTLKITKKPRKNQLALGLKAVVTVN